LFDNDIDGKVDRVTATFSETLAAYTAGNTPWTLANVPSGGTLASVSVTTPTVTLNITEGGAAANTAVGTMTVAMATNAGGVRDAAGNLASFAATAPADQAAPAIVTLSLLDNDGDGKVDRVTALFSETLLAPYTAANTPWTLANVPSAGTLLSVAQNSATLTLTLTEGGSAADTAVGTMTVAMASNAGGARDAAGNLGGFTATAPLDKAGPAPLSVTKTNAGIAGRAGPGDTLVITFSEPLAPVSVPASTTVTLIDPAGAGTIDTLTMTGISNGAGTTGAAGHVTVDGGTAAFANSAVALSGLNKVITVTVGAACAGGGCPTATAGTGTYSFLAATTLTDVASPVNVASTVAKTQSIVLF
jgi:hypothetical protein